MNQKSLCFTTCICRAREVSNFSQFVPDGFHYFILKGMSNLLFIRKKKTCVTFLWIPVYQFELCLLLIKNPRKNKSNYENQIITSIHVTSINVLKIMWTIKYIKNDQLLKLYSIFSFHNLLKNPWIIRKLSDKKHLARPACILYKVLISKLSDFYFTHTHTHKQIYVSWVEHILLTCDAKSIAQKFQNLSESSPCST